MKKSLLFLLVVLAVSFTLSGCSMKKQSTTSETMENTSETVAEPQTLEGVEAQQEMEAEPTLSNSTNTNDLAKELNETEIKAEDFSDL